MMLVVLAPLSPIISTEEGCLRHPPRHPTVRQLLPVRVIPVHGDPSMNQYNSVVSLLTYILKKHNQDCNFTVNLVSSISLL